MLRARPLRCGTAPRRAPGATRTWQPVELVQRVAAQQDMEGVLPVYLRSAKWLLAMAGCTCRERARPGE